jgi:hypothetical protein
VFLLCVALIAARAQATNRSAVVQGKGPFDQVTVEAIEASAGQLGEPNGHDGRLDVRRRHPPALPHRVGGALGRHRLQPLVQEVG